MLLIVNLQFSDKRKTGLPGDAEPGSSFPDKEIRQPGHRRDESPIHVLLSLLNRLRQTVGGFFVQNDNKVGNGWQTILKDTSCGRAVNACHAQSYIMKNMTHILALLLVCLTPFCKPGEGIAQSAATAVAVVGNREITAAQLSEALHRRVVSQQGMGDATAEKKLLLTEIIRQELLYAAALKEGYDQRPEIQEAVRLLLGRTYREEKLAILLNQVSVTDEELADSYRVHAAEHTTPARRQLALIEIRLPARATAEKREELRLRAEQARREVLALPATTRDFASVAVNYSDDQASRYRGGEIGWLTREQPNSRWFGPVLDALFSLAGPGMISPVLTTPEGYYLVKLLAIEKSALRPFHEVKEQIRLQLREKKKAQLITEFYTQLQKNVSVTINEQLLADMELPTPVTVTPPPLPGR